MQSISHRYGKEEHRCNKNYIASKLKTDREADQLNLLNPRDPLFYKPNIAVLLLAILLSATFSKSSNLGEA